MFYRLCNSAFHLKSSNCVFGQRRIEYLGHFVSFQGVEPGPSKIQAILQWPVSSSPKQLHRFLGLIGFYRCFVKHYAQIAEPLTHLLRKDQFAWSFAAQSAFDNLKQALTTTLVLSLPNFSASFVGETDISGSDMGVVLMQHGHPIAFFSKQFCTKLLCSLTYIRELHAITTAVKI